MKHRSFSRAIVAQIITGGIANEEGQVKSSASQASGPGTSAGSPAAGAATVVTS